MNANSSAIESTGTFAPFHARRLVANRINVLERPTRECVVPVRDDDHFYVYRRNELAAALKAKDPDSSVEQPLEAREDDGNQQIHQRERARSLGRVREDLFGQLGLEDRS